MSPSKKPICRQPSECSLELERQLQLRLDLEARAKEAYEVFAHRAEAPDYPPFEWLPRSAQEAWCEVVELLQPRPASIRLEFKTETGKPSSDCAG